MGLIGQMLNLVFGGGRNAIRETAEVFRENADSAAARDLDRLSAALAQHGAEFREVRGLFDRLMDAVNRLPRPMLALGTIGLFVSAMTDPEWFAARMQGLALVPEALWWLMGAVVSFYFGARHQVKGQQFQRELARTLTTLGAATAPDPQPEEPDTDDGAPNAALDDWRAARVS